MNWSWRTPFVRGVCFLLLWWVVSEGVWREWPLLIGSIVLATVASLFIWPPNAWRWRAWPLLRFLPWFLRASLRGGTDVARRAFRRDLPLQPGLIEYPLRLRAEAAQVFFAWTVSLLPGTACVAMSGHLLMVHVLDRQMANEQALRELEDRIGAVFLQPPDDR